MHDLMIRSILAASDLGPASDEVVGSAAALASRLGAGLHLLHSLDPRRLPPLESPTYPARRWQAEQMLAEQARRAAPGLEPASLLVVDHAPDRAIEERVAGVAADLVALGPHGGGDVGAHFLGTTAEAVLRAAAVPCLVVRGGLRLPPRRIGVPTDFSEPSRRALDLAVGLARRLGGPDGRAPELRVFHVGWTVDAHDDPTLERRELLPQLDRDVDSAVQRASGGTPPAVRAEVVWATDPVETIGTHAAAEEVDLLVMGTHGRGGLKRLLLGSVALGVARRARCPVLLVPPRAG